MWPNQIGQCITKSVNFTLTRNPYWDAKIQTHKLRVSSSQIIDHSGLNLNNKENNGKKDSSKQHTNMTKFIFYFGKRNTSSHICTLLSSSDPIISSSFKKSSMSSALNLWRCESPKEIINKKYNQIIKNINIKYIPPNCSRKYLHLQKNSGTESA